MTGAGRMGQPSYPDDGMHGGCRLVLACETGAAGPVLHWQGKVDAKEFSGRNESGV